MTIIYFRSSRNKNFKEVRLMDLNNSFIRKMILEFYNENIFVKENVYQVIENDFSDIADGLYVIDNTHNTFI